MTDTTEITSPGVIAVGESPEVGTGPEEFYARSVSQASELALRTLEVLTPDQPIKLNGALFDVSIDEPRLKRAVNVVAENQTVAQLGLRPRRVVVDTVFGRSNVEFNKGFQPTVIEHAATERAPLLTTCENGTSVNVTLPSDMISTSYTTDGLVEFVTAQANQDLIVGLGQNLKAKDRFHPGLDKLTMVLMTGTGEGVGIAISDDKWQEMLARGSGLAFAGLVLAVSGVIFAQRLKWGSYWSQFPAWAIGKSSDYEDIHTKLASIAREDPIISLKPVETDQSD
jgi:cytochrome c biogenesis protein ResB